MLALYCGQITCTEICGDRFGETTSPTSTHHPLALIDERTVYQFNLLNIQQFSGVALYQGNQ